VEPDPHDAGHRHGCGGGQCRTSGLPILRYADDAINMPCQASTQWDALAHIFLDDKMWNGYPAELVDAKGAKKNGIENYRDKCVGRGVLLDIARWKGVDMLPLGYPITNADLDGCAAAQGVQIRKGDFVIVRTGHQEDCLKKGDWTGYAGGDAPGLAFETCYWIRQHDIAAICADTWGCEVRPERDGRGQPALALGRDPRHRHRDGRDLLRQGTGRGLRGRRGLRILLLRAAAESAGRGRIAREPAGDQVRGVRPWCPQRRGPRPCCPR
jgi:kynurenine formamidase